MFIWHPLGACCVAEHLHLTTSNIYVLPMVGEPGEVLVSTGRSLSDIVLLLVGGTRGGASVYRYIIIRYDLVISL